MQPSMKLRSLLMNRLWKSVLLLRNDGVLLIMVPARSLKIAGGSQFAPPLSPMRVKFQTSSLIWAAKDASICRTRASSQTSSSSSCSPVGTSVDIRRPSSQRSSTNSSGQRSEKVEMP